MKREEKNWVKCCATFFHSFVSTSFDWLMREMIQSIKCRWVIAVAISHHFSHSNSLNKKKKLIPSFVEMKTKNAMICLNGEGNKWWRINSSLTLQKRTKLKINARNEWCWRHHEWNALISIETARGAMNELTNESEVDEWKQPPRPAAQTFIHYTPFIPFRKRNEFMSEMKWIYCLLPPCLNLN